MSREAELKNRMVKCLQKQTENLMSTLYKFKWTERVTPNGAVIPALRATNAPEGSVFIGWPTPRSVEAGHSTGNPDRAMDCKSRLEDVVFLTAWGTPAARDWKSGDASQETLDRNARPLNELAMLAGWKTPCVPNGGRISGNQADIGKHQDGTKAQIGLENETKLSGWTTPTSTERSGQGDRNESLALDARLSGWTTPQAHDETGRSKGQKAIHGTLHGCACLVNEALLSGWRTPTACSDNSLRGNGQEPADRIAGGHTVNLQDEVRLTAFGDQPIGFLLGPNGWEIVPASGQLNPAHSRWLQGFPPAWDQAAIRAHREMKREGR